MSATKEQVIQLASRLRMDQKLFSEVKESMKADGYPFAVVQGAIALCEQITLYEQLAPYFNGDKL